MASWTEPGAPAGWPVEAHDALGLAVGVPAGWRTETAAIDDGLVVHRGPARADLLVVQHVGKADADRPLSDWIDVLFAMSGFPVPELVDDPAAVPELVEWAPVGADVDERLAVDAGQLYEGLAVLPGHPAELARLYTVLLRRGSDAWRIALSLMSACPPGAPDELVEGNDHARAAETFGRIALR